MGEEQILGDYRILKQMGIGPTGAVYLAEHRFIKRQYVLKVLPKELSQDRVFVQKFEEEIAKLSNLDHPHIVKVHNVSYADGVYFLVTDCVVDSIGETTNLAQYMAGRKERLREDELLSVTRQVASALDYLHEKGVAHLGLKLNNILIGKGKPGIDIFLSETALSKILNPAAVVTRTFHTICETLECYPIETTKEGEENYSSHPIEGEKLSKLSGSFLQTFAFLAPEQKRLKKVTAAADAYAFGVLVYYLITGQFPEGFFRPIKEQIPLYQFEWDKVLLQCLSSEVDRRPLKLLPLLGQKVEPVTLRNDASFVKEMPDVKTILPEPERAPEVAPPTSKFEPVISRPVTTPQPEPAMAVASVAAPPSASFSTPPPEPVMTAAPPTAPPPAPTKFEPVIQRQTIQPPPAPPEPTSVKLEMAEKRDLSEATATPMTPSEPERAVVSTLDRDPVVKTYQPTPHQQKPTDPIETEMVVVSGGRYMRGSNEGNRDEAPYHMVELESFAMDIHPVTNEQFVRFLEFMGGEKDQHYNDLIRLKDSRINRTAGKLSIESGYAKHPVVGVTWYGAVGYASWVGKRLPTEAEWETAARGNMENCPYPTGKTIEKNQANFFSSDTTAVMSYAANPYGVYDLAGNVYEWCQDWYGYNYYETTEHEPMHPKGPLQGVYRVLRGGCWKSLHEDLRCSHRHRNNPGTVNGTYGFRCAADVKEV